MRVLSFDTGETVGWAYQDERDDYPGGILDFGHIDCTESLKPLSEFLHNFNRPVDMVVIEKYVVWGGSRGAKANTGSTLPTVRGIGVIESWCYLRDLPYSLEYDSNMCKLQSMQTGLDPYKKAHKNTHWAFAANHGRYWLQAHGYAKDIAQRSGVAPIKGTEKVDAYKELFGGKDSNNSRSSSES